MKLDCVLLVEDNEDDAILVECALEDAGIPNPVHRLETAEEAISYLSGAGKYADRSMYPIPSVLLVDLKLPGKSGHDLLKWIKGRKELRHLIKVVLTGSNDPGDRNTAFALGANCYLEKPLTKQQLVDPSRSIHMILTKRGAVLHEVV